MATILVIDDEISIATLLQETLADEGYMVVVANSGRDGLDLLARMPIDLVLCDVMMPGMNGIQVCAAIDKLNYQPPLPIILMSAVVAGVAMPNMPEVYFTPKPFDIDYILRMVGMLLR